MKSFFDYLRAVIFDGILFLIPIIFIFYLFKLIIDFIDPISDMLPEGAIFGLGFKNLAAFFILMLVIIIGGYINRSSAGRLFAKSIGDVVIKIIPGFSVLKKIFSGDKDIKSVLAYIDDAWLFGFILEEKSDAGLITVFVPSAPIPTSGNVYLMKEEQIKRLDIKTSEAVKCITQLGVGSSEILKGKIK